MMASHWFDCFHRLHIASKMQIHCKGLNYGEALTDHDLSRFKNHKWGR